ncbi:Ring canal kelch protein [Gryllus bimaculatus]|nr:Ring canal kelch protein [Gryllus bimaculatus]
MIVVGISGVTNGGKTTLANALHKALPRSHLLCQDTYFWHKDSGHHVLIPEVNHFNWEIMSSLDMDRMWKDINNILNGEHLHRNISPNDGEPNTIQGCEVIKNVDDFEILKNVDVLIIEGFLVLNYKPIVDICNLKYHLTLAKDECVKRRNARTYDPPDVPGYFELCVWPEYVKHKAEMLQTVGDVKVIDGTIGINSIFCEVVNDICEKANHSFTEPRTSRNTLQVVSSMKFCDQIYPTLLLQDLSELRKSGVLCDVSLVVNNEELLVHKSILAAASPYFRAMFSTEMKEANQEKIFLQESEFSALKDIVNFIYTAEIKIDEENVYSILELSDLLQISSLRPACSYYLSSTLSPANCLSVYVTAELRGYHDLADTAFKYALHHFSAVIAEEEFLHVPVDVLKSVLDSQMVNVKNEGELLKGVVQWYKYDLSRAEYLKCLVTKINLRAVPMEILLRVKTEPEVSNTVLYPSIAQTVIFTFGGQCEGAVWASGECFTASYESWRCVVPRIAPTSGAEDETRVIPSMNHGRYYFAVATTEYKMFVIGGKDNSSALNSVECYDIQSNSWQEMEPLPEPLFGSGAALVERQLVVVGGFSDSQCERRVWAYREPQKNWCEVASMHKYRAHHGVACVAGRLYAIGGIGGATGSSTDTLSCVECYSPQTDRWHFLAPMHEARSRFGCAAINEFIYALGGTADNIWLKSVERFNTLTNDWSYLRSMGVPRCDFAMTMVKDRIYCLGGNDSVHLLSTAEKYNTRTDRWHCMHSLQVVRCGAAAATLFVPSFNPFVSEYLVR